MFIRIFSTETKALDFVRKNGGKITIKYDWDSNTNKMIKMYVVKY